MTLEEQVKALEKEVSLLRRLAELEEEKRQLKERIETAKPRPVTPLGPTYPACDPEPSDRRWVVNRIPCGGDLP